VELQWLAFITILNLTAFQESPETLYQWTVVRRRPTDADAKDGGGPDDVTQVCILLSRDPFGEQHRCESQQEYQRGQSSQATAAMTRAPPEVKSTRNKENPWRRPERVGKQELARRRKQARQTQGKGGAEGGGPTAMDES